MTTLVAITDVPSLGLTAGDIVTDDSSVAASSDRARLKSSAYVAGLFTGNLRRAFVAQDPATGAPVVPSQTDLFVSSLSQSIVYSAPSLGLTPAQILSLVQSYLSSTGAISGALTGSISGSGSLTGSASLYGGTDAVSGTVPGQGSLSGSLTAQVPGSAALTGTVPGSGVLTGAATTQAGGNDALVGTIPGGATLSGSITSQAPGTVALSGTVPGTGTLTGSLSTSAASPMTDFSNPANSQYAAALAA